MSENDHSRFTNFGTTTTPSDGYDPGEEFGKRRRYGMSGSQTVRVRPPKTAWQIRRAEKKADPNLLWLEL